MNTPKEILIPLNDVRHLFFNPDCDPFEDRNLTISGLDYAIKQLRMKPLPEKIRLNLHMSKGSRGIDAMQVQHALHSYCLNVVKEKEEDYSYLSWQIHRNFKRMVLPFLAITIAFGWFMYSFLEERVRFMQILLVLLNNLVIVMGWVLLWIPAEMFLYEAPRVKREIALYKLLADADVHIGK